ncbi:MAG: hypothetical protein ABI693_08060, partial [Bryobacteraceae bacterium]
MDTLTSDDWKALQPAFPSLLKKPGSDQELRIAVLGNGNIQFAGPFATRAQLRAALAEIATSPEPAPVSPESALALYRQIGSAAPSLGDGWAQVLVIGRLPEVPEGARDYTAALMLTRFTGQRLRLSVVQVEGDDAAVLGPTIKGTAGSSAGSLTEWLAGVPAVAPEMVEVVTAQTAPPDGFRLYRAEVRSPNGESLSFPAVTAAPSFQLPDPARYLQLDAATRGLRDLQADSKSQASDAVPLIETALAINPRAEDALDLGARILGRSGDFGNQARLLTLLADLRPNDGALFDSLGRALYLSGSKDKSAAPLEKARQLSVHSAEGADFLARLAASANRNSDGLTLSEESLSMEPKNLELWLLRAELAAKSNDWERRSDALEHALALDGSLLDPRLVLIDGYLQRQQIAKAAVHLEAATAAKPSSAPICASLASWWEAAKQPKRAVETWRMAIAADNAYEAAHWGLASFEERHAHYPAALAAATAGIAAVPASGRLRVLENDLLMRSGEWRKARMALSVGLQAASADRAVLERFARSEDTFGPAAAGEYRKLAAIPPPSAEAGVAVLRRGLLVSLRDGAMDDAAWFRERLAAQGETTAQTLFPSGKPDDAQATTIVPGGLESVATMARLDVNPHPDRFFRDLAGSIASTLQYADKKALEVFSETMRKHFERVRALEALGKKDGDRTTVTLSLNDKTARRLTEKVLAILGLRMKSTKEGLRIDAVEKGEAAGRQETAAAIELDSVALNEALAQKKPFMIEIRHTRAAVFPPEEEWRKVFYDKESLPGGFTEAMARDPRLAKTYVGLNSVDRATALALLKAAPLKTLATDYSDLLAIYAVCLAVKDGRVVVPGGAAANAAWERAAGASPAQPDAFLRALLKKDGGRLLAYYHALSEIDSPRQRFFTRTPARVEKFYQRFTQSLPNGAIRPPRDDSFSEFLSETPVDDEGHVEFPGGPEVWLVAKGTSREGGLNRLQKRMSKVTVPEEEDAILLRLASLEYTFHGVKRTELDNLVAVSRIEAHRAEPMDAQSALILAQFTAQYRTLFPYLSSLRAMDFEGYRAFFALAAKLESIDNEEERQFS